MSDNPSELLAGHVRWADNAAREEWGPIRAAWRGDFWNQQKRARNPTWETVDDRVTGLLDDSGLHEDPHYTETNLVAPFVSGFIASLYYNGIRVVVELDELPGGYDSEEAALKAAAVRNLCNRFLGTSTVDDVTERLFSMGLVYRGGCAFKLRVDDPATHNTESPLDLVSIEAVPPWECFWDRRLRSLRDERWRGHLRQMPLHVARSIWSIPEDYEPTPLRDIVRDGYLLESHEEFNEVVCDESYVWILTFDDYTDEWTEGDVRMPGVRIEYLVKRIASHVEPELEELARGPIPLAWPDGRPASEIVEFIPDPNLEFQLDSNAAAKNVFELNSELNRAQSVLAGAFRRDARRNAITDIAGDEEIGKVQDGRDLEIIKVKRDPKRPISDRYHVIEWGQISATLAEYVGMVREGLDRSQLTADFTRGKAGDYLSATEVANLVEYTTATIGRIRKRADMSIGRLCQLYCIAMADLLEDDDLAATSVTVMVEDQEVTLTPEDLNRRWKISVVDTAATPGASAQKLADFQAAMGPMMDLAATIDPPTPDGLPSNMQRNLAMQGIKFLTEQLRLPANFDPQNLLKTPPPMAQTPQPEPEPTPAMDAPPDMMAPPATPEELANSPVAQAIMNAAEGI